MQYLSIIIINKLYADNTIQLYPFAVPSLSFPTSPISDYAKLIRKRDKTLGADGQPIRIDLETLRASTRAAGDKENSQQPDTVMHKSSNEHAPPPAQSHPHSQPHTPGTQSVNASPNATVTSKPPVHSNNPHPTNAPSSGPYSYAPLASSAGGGAGSIPPSQSAPPGGHVDSIPAGHSVWSNQSARSYGGDHPSYLRASHTPSEPRSTST